MATREQMLAELAAAQQQGFTPPAPAAPAAPAAGVSRAQMLAEIEAAKGQGFIPPRALLSLKKKQVQRSWGDRLRGAAASVSEPWVESAKGIHQLIGGSPEELSKYDATIAELRRQSPQGVGRTVGNVAGEALQFALPGGVGAKLGTKALTAVAAKLAARRGAALSAAALGESAGIGGFEAAATPGTARERAQAGATGAVSSLAGAGIGAGIGRGFQKAREGIRRSPEAQQLLDAGVPLTPGQAGTSPVLRKAEENMGFVPLMSDKVEGLQRASVEAAQPWVMQKTLPDLPGFAPVKITDTGRDGFRQAYKAHGGRFNQFWERAYNRLGDDQARILANSIDNTVTNRAAQELGDDQAQKISRIVTTAAQKIHRSPGRESLQQFNRTLQDAASDAWATGSRQEARILQDVIGDLESTFGDAAPLLKEINRGYAGLKVLERAGGYKSALQEGYIAPENLMSAVKAEGRPKQLVLGEAMLQPEAELLTDTIGALVPKGKRLGERFATVGAAGGLAVPKTRMLTLAAMLGGRYAASEPMRRAMVGQTGWQNWLGKRDLEQLKKALARIGAPTAAGYTSNERGN